MGGRLERIVIAGSGQRHADNRKPLAAGRIVDARHILRQLVGVPERGHGNAFLGFLVHHHGHAGAAIGMAAAAQLAPVGLRAVHQVAPIGECRNERNRKPIARGLAQAHLVLHVVREVGERVTLRLAAFVGHRLVAAGERDRLEGKERDLFRIIERELDDPSHLLIIDAVDDGDDRNDIDAVRVQILDRAQLHVEQVAHLAMLIGGVADAIELQIGVAQAGIRRLAAEFRALGELDAVGGRLHRGVAHFARVPHRIQEVGRDGRLAARKLHRHLALRLDGDGVVEQGLNIFPAQLMHEPHLVGIHETRIAHHVAAVGQVDGQYRAAAVGDGAGAVLVQRGIVVRADVAAREDLLDVPVEGRIDGHHILEMAVNGAVLHHQDLAVPLDDFRLDLTGALVVEDLERRLAVQDALADFRHAARAQRIGFARPAQWRLRLFPTLEKRLVRPPRYEARILMDLIQLVEDRPGRIGGYRQNFFGILYRLVHRTSLLWWFWRFSAWQAPGARSNLCLSQYRQSRGRSTTGWH